MYEKRGQAGIEYIVLIGVLLVFLIPIVYYSLDQSSFQVKVSQIENALKRLTKASDSVYALGPGARDVVVITMPHGIEEIQIENYTINFKVSILGGISDYGFPTIANVTGTFPKTPGTYRILIIHEPTGHVNLTLKE